MPVAAVIVCRGQTAHQHGEARPARRARSPRFPVTGPDAPVVLSGERSQRGAELRVAVADALGSGANRPLWPETVNAVGGGP